MNDKVKIVFQVEIEFPDVNTRSESQYWPGYSLSEVAATVQDYIKGIGVGGRIVSIIELGELKEA